MLNKRLSLRDDDMEYVDASGIRRKKKTDVPQVKGSVSATLRANAEQKAQARADEEKQKNMAAAVRANAEQKAEAEAQARAKAEKQKKMEAAASAYAAQQAQAEAQARADEEAKNRAVAAAERAKVKKQKEAAASAFAAQQAQAEAQARADEEAKNRAVAAAERAKAKRQAKADAETQANTWYENNKSYATQGETWDFDDYLRNAPVLKTAQDDYKAALDALNRQRGQYTQDEFDRQVARLRELYGNLSEMEKKGATNSYLKQGDALSQIKTFGEYLSQREGIEAYTQSYWDFLDNIIEHKGEYTAEEYTDLLNQAYDYYLAIDQMNQSYGLFESQEEYDAWVAEQLANDQNQLPGLETDATSKRAASDQFKKDGQYIPQAVTLQKMDDERELSQMDLFDIWQDGEEEEKKASQESNLSDYMGAASDGKILRYLKQSAEDAYPNLPDEATSRIAESTLAQMGPEEKAAASGYMKDGLTSAAYGYLDWIRKRNSASADEKYEMYMFGPAYALSTPPGAINTLPGAIGRAAIRAGWDADIGGRGDDIVSMSKDLLKLMTDYEVNGFTNAYAHGYEKGGDKGGQAEASAYLDSRMGELLALYNQSFVDAQPLIDIENVAEEAERKLKDTQNEIKRLERVTEDEAYYQRSQNYKALLNEPDAAKMIAKGQAATSYVDFYNNATLEDPSVNGKYRSTTETSGIQANYLGLYNELDFYLGALPTFLSEDEKKVYYYLLGSEGGAAADEYYNFLNDALNLRMAKDNVARIERSRYKLFGATLTGMVVGLDRATQGVKKAGKMIIGSDAEDKPTVLEYTGTLLRKSDAIRYGPIIMDGKTLGEIIYDGGETVGNMLPSIALSLILSPVAGAVFDGVSTAGNTYAAALHDGFTSTQARNYALLIGASEGGMQYLLKGVGKGLKGGKKLADKLMTKMGMESLAKIDSAMARVALKLGGQAFSEGSEEYIQEIMGPVLRNIALDEHNEFKPFTEEALYKAVMGAITGTGEDLLVDHYRKRRKASKQNAEGAGDSASGDEWDASKSDASGEAGPSGVSSDSDAVLKNFAKHAGYDEIITEQLLGGYVEGNDPIKYATSFSRIFGAGKTNRSFQDLWKNGELPGFDEKRAVLTYDLGQAYLGENLNVSDGRAGADLGDADSRRPAGIDRYEQPDAPIGTGADTDGESGTYTADDILGAAMNGDGERTQKMFKAMVDASDAEHPERAVLGELRPQLKERYFELYENGDVEGLSEMDTALSSMKLEKVTLNRWLVTGCYDKIQNALEQGDMDTAKRFAGMLKEDFNKSNDMISANLDSRLGDVYVDMRRSGKGAQAEALLQNVLKLGVGNTRDPFKRKFEKATKKK